MIAVVKAKATDLHNIMVWYKREKAGHPFKNDRDRRGIESGLRVPLRTAVVILGFFAIRGVVPTMQWQMQGRNHVGWNYLSRVEQQWGRVISTATPLTVAVAGRRKLSNHWTSTRRGDHSLQSRNTLKPYNYPEVAVNHLRRIMIVQNLLKENKARRQSASVTTVIDAVSFS